MRRFIISLLFIASFAALNAQSLSKEKWINDIEYLKQTLPDKHISLFSLMPEDEFNRELDFLISKIEDLSDAEIAIRLKKIMVSMGDSNTDIDIRKFIDDKKLPLQLYWFSDGLYVLHTIQAHEDLLGKKLLTINDTPVEIIADSLSKLFVNLNSSSIKKHAPQLIVNVQLLTYFGFANSDRIKITFADEEFEVAKIVTPEPLLIANRISFKHKSMASYWENEKEFFTERYIPENKMLYMQYNICASKEHPTIFSDVSELPSFGDFEDEIQKDIEEFDIDKFVIDMRLNRGGSPLQGADFIRKIAQNEKINNKGKLYVIIGRATHSVAIVNALSLKELTDAVFVGEPLSSKLNPYGEMRTFDLPNSRMMITYSTKYSNKYTNDNSIIEVGFTIDESFNDYTNGIDPVLEWIEKR